MAGFEFRRAYRLQTDDASISLVAYGVREREERDASGVLRVAYQYQTIGRGHSLIGEIVRATDDGVVVVKDANVDARWRFDPLTYGIWRGMAADSEVAAEGLSDAEVQGYFLSLLDRETWWKEHDE